MAVLDKQSIEIIKRLQKVKIGMIRENPFFGVLAMNVPMALDELIDTACTDGKRIIVSPEFMEELSDSELSFVLLHEIMHMALKHCYRSLPQVDPMVSNIAADIIVNSNILQGFGEDVKKITLAEYGESMHEYKGKEGREYSLEELSLLIAADHPEIKTDDAPPGGSDDDGKKGNSNDESSDGDGNSKGSGESKGNKKSKENGESKGDGNSKGSGESKGNEKSKETGEGKGDGKNNGDRNSKGDRSSNASIGQAGGDGLSAGDPFAAEGKSFDDHSEWNRKGIEDPLNQMEELQWDQRILEAAAEAELIEELFHSQSDKTCGSIPVGMKRIIEKLTTPQTDWRTILNDFVQEEITDYSFDPPDRRMQDSPFMLPDFNEKEDSLKNLLFMIDTSASMSRTMITNAYSEVYGAIQQFNGRVQGWLGFFDAKVVPPTPFKSEDEFEVIRAFGGGGTSFECILRYVKEEWKEDELPSSIIILTDGYAPFPKEEEADGIPVLWIINNEEITPPWGKVARIKITNK